MAIILSTRFRQRQAGVGLLVLGLHLLAIMAWWSQEHHLPKLHHDSVVTPISVWLQELPKTVAPQLKAMPAHTAPTQQYSAPQKDQQHPASTASTEPAASLDAIPAPASNSAGLPAPASSAPALNLNIAPKDMASLAAPSFAAQSPFHGRLPASVERQIANAAAQTGPWTEERVDMDHIRFRRGNNCIMMERPRAAALDPFNDAYARMPWKASTTDC